MSNLYKKNPIYLTIELFCSIKGISIGAMCKSAGVSPGLVTDLKMGRKQTIQVETAAKISKALDTDVNTLLNNKYSSSHWDVDARLKWMSAEDDYERTILLEENGVDSSFFLQENASEWKKQLIKILFDQNELSLQQKEKSPTPEGMELDEETIQLQEIWNGADKEERKALLAMAEMLKARRNK